MLARRRVTGLARPSHLCCAMPKAHRPARSRRRPAHPSVDHQVPDLVTQVKCALRHPRAALAGAVVGGLPPWIGQQVAHGEVGAAWWVDPRSLVVLGCMLFSVLTVYAFGRSTFHDRRKAAGFVVAMELAMVFSSLWSVRIVTLLAVIAINALTTGARIATAYETAERRRDADRRRAATRAAGRAARGPQPAGDRGVAGGRSDRGPASIPVSAPAPVGPQSWTRRPSSWSPGHRAPRLPAPIIDLPS